MKLSEYVTDTFVLDRHGNIVPTNLCIPCSTYIERKLNKLSPMDAEFLLEHEMISDIEATSVILEAFLDYMSSCMLTLYNLLNVVQFVSWAQMKETPAVRSIALHLLSKGSLIDVLDMCKRYPSFRTINSAWYPYIRNDLARLTVTDNTLNFTIGVDDIAGWIQYICKCVLPQHASEFVDYNVTVVAEDCYRCNNIIQDVAVSQLIYSHIHMLRPDSYIRWSDDEVKTQTQAQA